MTDSAPEKAHCESPSFLESLRNERYIGRALNFLNQEVYNFFDQYQLQNTKDGVQVLLGEDRKLPLKLKDQALVDANQTKFPVYSFEDFYHQALPIALNNCFGSQADGRPAMSQAMSKQIFERLSGAPTGPHGFPVGTDWQYFPSTEALEAYRQQAGFLTTTGINNFDERTRQVAIEPETLKHFKMLQELATKKGVELRINEAYRDFEAQRKIQNKYPKNSERLGWSEHHLGTAIDFRNMHDRSAQFFFMLEHGFDQGFVPTYLFGNTERRVSKSEPWHWRFVGLDIAQDFQAQWQSEIDKLLAKKR